MYYSERRHFIKLGFIYFTKYLRKLSCNMLSVFVVIWHTSVCFFRHNLFFHVNSLVFHQDTPLLQQSKELMTINRYLYHVIGIIFSLVFPPNGCCPPSIRIIFLKYNFVCLYFLSTVTNNFLSGQSFLMGLWKDDKSLLRFQILSSGVVMATNILASRWVRVWL